MVEYSRFSDYKEWGNMTFSPIARALDLNFRVYHDVSTTIQTVICKMV